MRQTSAVQTRNGVRARSGLHGGFTIVETLIALSMVLLVTHVILRSVPGIYRASAHSAQLQLKRSMWYSIGAEEWLQASDEDRLVPVEKETDREGWMRIQPEDGAKAVPLWRGKIDKVQQQQQQPGQGQRDF